MGEEVEDADAGDRLRHRHMWHGCAPDSPLNREGPPRIRGGSEQAEASQLQGQEVGEALRALVGQVDVG